MIAHGDRKINILDVGCEKQAKFVKHLKPKRLRDKFIRKYPNLFGYQIVIKTKPQ